MWIQSLMIPHTTRVEEFTKFVCTTSVDDLSGLAVQQLKKVLDALGRCAIGALYGPPVRRILKVELDRKKRCTLIGGGRMAPEIKKGFIEHRLSAICIGNGIAR